MHSVEYLLKKAQEPVQVTRKKAAPKIKDEHVAMFEAEIQEPEVDWNPLTQTLQGMTL